MPAVRVDDWPNPPRPFKTIAVHTDNFFGNITIQASIYLNPTDDQWFDISSVDYMPVIQGQNVIRNSFINTRDRYIWMRATFMGMGRVDRVLVI